MPPRSYHGTNGQSKHHANGASRQKGAPLPQDPLGDGGAAGFNFAEQLERNRTPHVEIGNRAKYTEPEGDEDDTGSFADVDKLVQGVRWQVNQFLAFGMLTGLIAQPKTGKSAFALYALAKPIITGGMWFNRQFGPREPGYVVYCDTESSAALNLSRAKQWGLPLDRIKTPFKDVLQPVNLENEGHIDRIFSVVCRYKASLVIIDSFRGSHDGDENNSKLVVPLRRLGRLAEDSNASVVVIHHTGKMSVGSDMTINAGRGSNAFLAAVRAQIAIDMPDPTPDLRSCWRRVQVLGENLGIAPKPFGFLITEDGLQYGPAPERPQEKTEIDEAVAWLKEKMEPGKTYDSGDLQKEAEQYGITARTLRRAATDRLGIEPAQVRKDKKIAGWSWTLPT